jgi:hypothetical protein
VNADFAAAAVSAIFLFEGFWSQELTDCWILDHWAGVFRATLRARGSAFLPDLVKAGLSKLRESGATTSVLGQYDDLVVF